MSEAQEAPNELESVCSELIRLATASKDPYAYLHFAGASVQYSQAISLKRIADSLETLTESVNTPDEYGLTGSQALSNRLKWALSDFTNELSAIFRSR